VDEKCLNGAVKGFLESLMQYQENADRHKNLSIQIYIILNDIPLTTKSQPAKSQNA